MGQGLHILCDGKQAIAENMAAQRQVFARFPFGDDVNPHGTDFSIPLPLLGGVNAVEQWQVESDVTFERKGDLQLAFNDDFLLARVVYPGVPENLRQLSFDSYHDLLVATQSHGYPHILKCWNFVPGINDGEGDAENYKQFCIGRADAFQQAGTMERYVPAGTAIGNAVELGLTVYLLAGKTAPQAVENPRQISAYKYPRQYGPRSPSFSRAACFSLGHGRKAMLLSGTAAIVGHKSLHVEDGYAQLKEIRTNVEALLQRGGMPPLKDYGQSDSHGAAMRMFVRSGAQQQAIIDRYPEVFPELSNTVIFEADICRHDLQVEIDGVLWAPE